MNNDSIIDNIVLCSEKENNLKKIKLLLNATEKSIKTFNFSGINSYCKVTNVYDGDTCRVIFFYKNELIRLTVRLSGIDAPEMKSTNPNEILLAKEAKQVVSDYLLNKISYIKIGKNDKFKRPLAYIYICNDEYNISNQTINEILKNKGLAKEYNGGKKELW